MNSGNDSSAPTHGKQLSSKSSVKFAVDSSSLSAGTDTDICTDTCTATEDYEYDDLPPSYSVSGMPVLGEGSFGKVVRSRDLRDPSRLVAVKTIRSRIQYQKSHYCLYLYRELYMLRKMNHPNVIALLDVRAPNFNPLDKAQIQAGGQDGSLDVLQLVFECADCDLDKFIRKRRRKRGQVTLEETKKILYQLLVAIKYVHSANIIHRDIKPENLLLWEENLVVKLTDFGLARIVEQEECRTCPPQKAAVNEEPSVTTGNNDDPSSTPGIIDDIVEMISSVSGLFSNAVGVTEDHNTIVEVPPVPPEECSEDVVPPPPSMSRHLTQHVVSRWYRAPEVILLEDYDYAVDIWSIGCVLGDLLGQGRPLFPGGAVAPLSKEPPHGEANNNQLGVIFQVIGSPSEEDIECVSSPAQKEYLKQFQHLPQTQSLESFLPDAPAEALDLLASMLTFNKTKRCSVNEALAHPFLSSVRDESKEISMEEGLEMNIVPEKSLAQKKYICRKIMEEIIIHRKNGMSAATKHNPDDSIEGN